jgi:hypothetical protein
MDVKDIWWVTVDWTKLGMQIVLRYQIKCGVLCIRWWTFLLNERQRICFSEQRLASSAALWSRSGDFAIKFWATFSLSVLSKHNKHCANLIMSAPPSVCLSASNDATLWHWMFRTLNNVPNLSKNRLKITEITWRTKQNGVFVFNMGENVFCVCVCVHRI